MGILLDNYILMCAPCASRLSAFYIPTKTFLRQQGFPAVAFNSCQQINISPASPADCKGV